MSYTIFATKLGEILEAVKVAPGSSLAVWYPYPDPESDEMPYATIDHTSATERALDTNTNIVEYEFRIRVANRDIGNSLGGRTAVETVMRAVVDEVTAEMRKKTHIQLDGTSVHAYAVRTEWGSNVGNGPLIRYADIIITIEALYSIS